MRVILFVIIIFYLALSGIPAQAADRLFTLVKVDGQEIEITRELFDEIGITNFSTKLVGGDGNRHQASGVLIRDLLNHFKIEGKFLRVLALNKYEADIPLSDTNKYDVVFATKINGRRLSVREKGPAWVIYPMSDKSELDSGLIALRSVWQIDRVQLF